MCGIVGLWPDEENPKRDEIVAAMRDTMPHRGPDQAGIWGGPPDAPALGFRRLAILDLTELGEQPMSIDDDRFHMVFNGQIYNHHEICDQLEGYKPTGRSDSEVLLKALSTWGPEKTLQRCRGMFAIALWDAQERTLLLARDRMGEKPLAFGRWNNSWLFASELKALASLPYHQPAIDQRKLGSYFTQGYVPNSATIFEGFAQVKPGSYTVLSQGGTSTTHSYWSLYDKTQMPRLQGSDERLTDDLDGLLQEVVTEQMESDVPLGAFLSGGVDSSLVTAMMCKASSSSIRTFSIGFDDDEHDESAHASLVADHLGTDHTALHLTSEHVEALLPRLATVYDEPFADVSCAPLVLLAELASEHVTVALTGDGADEIFGGYGWYLRDHKRSPRNLLPTFARTASQQLLSRIDPWLIEKWATTLLRDSTPGLGLKGERLVGQLGDRNSKERWMRRNRRWPRPASIVNGGDRLPRGTQPNPMDSSLGLREFQMLHDSLHLLPEGMLVKVDRATMHSSLEARAPFLDARVVEFAMRLPLDARIRENTGKWLVREVLARYVPASIVERPKHGFTVPIGDWLRGPLQSWGASLLTHDKLTEHNLRPFPIQRLWGLHQAGQNYERRLWPVLQFIAWSDAKEAISAPLPHRR